MTVTTHKWTVNCYHQVVEVGVFDELSLELLNGEVIEMLPEEIAHASLSSDVADYLREIQSLPTFWTLVLQYPLTFKISS